MQIIRKKEPNKWLSEKAEIEESLTGISADEDGNVLVRVCDKNCINCIHTESCIEVFGEIAG